MDVLIGYMNPTHSGKHDIKILSKPLSDEELAEFDNMTRAIFRAMSRRFIEKVFIENCRNLREYVNSIGKKETLYHMGADSIDLIDLRSKIFTLCVNIVSSFGIFVDNMKHSVQEDHGVSSKEFDILCRYLSQEFDSHRSYRIFSKLRNYCVHRSLPIGKVVLDGERDINTGFLRSSARPILMSEKLLEWKNWGRVRKDVESMGVEIEFSVLVNEIELIIHDVYRFSVIPEYFGLSLSEVYFSTISRMLEAPNGSVMVLWSRPAGSSAIPTTARGVVPTAELQEILYSLRPISR